MSWLSLEAVSKRHGRTVALDRVDLEVREGARVAILGPSGSGKTTLLRIVGGFDTPDAGRVVLDGAVLADGPRAVPAHLRRIGFVAQDGALFPHLTIAENVAFGLHRKQPDRAGAVADLMRLVDLDHALLTRTPDQLSGGQQQRVSVARALAQRPRLMLLDEPFSALDTGLRASTRQAVGDLLDKAGIATILVTHDQQEALSFADQLVVMKDGRALQVGSPRELYLKPHDRFVAEFLGDAIILPAAIEGARASCAFGWSDLSVPSRDGAGEIVIRPEQIRLSAQGLDGADLGSSFALGLVDDVTFGGADCMVRVRVIRPAQSAPGGPWPMTRPHAEVLAEGEPRRTHNACTSPDRSRHASVEALPSVSRDVRAPQDEAVGRIEPGSACITFTVRRSYLDAPERGSTVSIQVLGPVHRIGMP